MADDTSVVTVPADGSAVTIPGLNVQIKVEKTESKVKAWFAKVWSAVKAKPAVFVYGAVVGAVASKAISLIL